MNTAKTYLKKLYAAEAAVKILRKEILRRKSMQDDGVDEIEQNLQKALKEYEEIRERITREIVSLPDGRFQKVLYLAYVEQLPIWKIARRLNYSQDHANKLHRMALECFAKTVLKEGK